MGRDATRMPSSLHTRLGRARPQTTERMADFWPLCADDALTDDDDDGRPPPTSTTSVPADGEDAFDRAVGSFDDELVRANIHLIFLLNFLASTDAGSGSRVSRVFRFRSFVSFVSSLEVVVKRRPGTDGRPTRGRFGNKPF